MRPYEIKITETLDRGLSYGEACFETMRVVDGEVFQSLQHQQRLQRGMRALGWDLEALVVHQWFQAAMRAASQKGRDVLIRLTVSGGDAGWGWMPKPEQRLNVYVQTLLMGERAALHLRSVVWMFPLREKVAKFTADYADILRSMQQWKNQLGECEQPLICTESGDVLSSMTANVLIYYQNRWYTPDGLGVLCGVVRAFLMDKGVIHPTSCPQSWLDTCEAMACINSGVGVQPVASINGRTLNREHKAFDNLRAAFECKAGVAW